MSDSIAALLERMKPRGLKAALLSQPAHIFYLTGHMPAPSRHSFLLVRPGEVLFIGGMDDANALEGAADGLVHVRGYEDYSIDCTIDLAHNASEALQAGLASWGGLDPFGIEFAHLPLPFAQLVAANGAALADVTPDLLALRRRKLPHEIAAIERSVNANDSAFAAVREALRAGLSELELLGAAYAGMCRVADRPPLMRLDFVDAISGPRTWEIGGPATGRRLQRKDVLLLDLATSIAGYYGDTTRCFCLGDPNAEQYRLHYHLEQALEAGQNALRPGRRACELDGIVRGILEKAGYGRAQFPHHTGHGIGLAPQEAPWIIPGNDQLLEEGMVLTLEPGLYVPGMGGMRLEEDFVITADGCRPLSRYPRRLTLAAL